MSLWPVIVEYVELEFERPATPPHAHPGMADWRRAAGGVITSLPRYVSGSCRQHAVDSWHTRAHDGTPWHMKAQVTAL